MESMMVIFPGQGSQGLNMGRDLAEKDSDAMDLWKKAEQISSLPLREIYWDGDEASMSDTRALQIALTCVNCNLWRYVAGKVEPFGSAGHSLGEFSALVCAGVLDMTSALELTSLRGRLMAEADPHGAGSMAAIVKLSREAVANIVEEAKKESEELVIMANFNSPAQIVVSGTKKAVELVCQKAKAIKGRGVPLKVSAAFHSAMMQEANQEFIRVFDKYDWHSAKFPVYGNVDALGERDGARIRQKMEVQMTSPVLWMDSVVRQYSDGARAWLELGPKSLLLKMVDACLPKGASVSLEEVHDAETLEAFLGKV